VVVVDVVVVGVFEMARTMIFIGENSTDFGGLLLS
jgi:hypothetical protein